MATTAEFGAWKRVIADQERGYETRASSARAAA